MSVYLSYSERCKIEALYNAKHSISEIATFLGRHRSTIYREIKRGMYSRLEYRSYKFISAYSADIAHDKYLVAQTSKGAPFKIGHDYNLVSYIEEMILEHGYSPDAVIGRIKQQGLCFETTICTRTLYNYINSGLFLNLSNKQLPMRGKRNIDNSSGRSSRIRPVLSRGIEYRPEAATSREFGHWEIDTVIGKSKESSCLLVLTERHTRYEIIHKIDSRTQVSVISALDTIEQQYGHTFQTIFKTITSDNGTEFLDYSSIERSSLYPGQKRTSLYYANPYSAWERGSNENANRLIRRYIPKSSSIAKYTDEYVKHVEKWIQNYPRKLLGYRTSAEVFNECLNYI